MVTTRGHQPVQTAISTAVERIILPDASAPYGTLSSNHEDLRNGEHSTIGSRLRKRRRTGSSPKDSKPPSPKPSTRRKATSPNSKRAHRDGPLRAVPHSSPRDVAVQIAPEEIFQTISGSALLNKMNGMVEKTSSTANTDYNEHKKQSLSLEQQASISELLQQARGLDTTSSAAPDLAAVIANIIDHGETVDSHRAAQIYNDMGMVDTESFLPLGASLHLKTQSLPILDNLATQILNTLAKSTYQEILTIATEPDSDSGQAYTTLKSLFDHTKKVYSISDPFLSPYQLGLSEQAHIDTIRKANLATFVSSVFGSQDVGFYHLNEYFLDTFVADGNRLLKSQAQLFLDLKTQAYISATSHGERSREEILEDLFPMDLEERLLSRRPGAKQLAPSEADFLQRARNRSKALLEEAITEEAIAVLPEKYIWEDFLRDVSAYVSKNFETIVGTPVRKPIRPGRPPNFFVTDQQRQRHSEQNWPSEHDQQKDIVQPSTKVLIPEHAQVNMDTDDIAEKAARAAQFAMQGFGITGGASVPLQGQSQDQPQQQVTQVQIPPPPQHIQYQFEHQPPPAEYYHQVQYHNNQQLQHHLNQQPLDMSLQYPAYTDHNSIPYPTQTAPTQVLYERARMAATAKASPSNRRAGHPSQRRPWTTDEENSLMAGLDRVKGPHWSQILAMFGPGGTINETLKDRNQVQLKDKARNLKLFFLKSGIEVPYYLQFVTGELKTRAPAQAAKNEQKEKSRMSEDRAHVEGVMTLAGGSLQDFDQTGEEGMEEDTENGDVPMESTEDDAPGSSDDVNTAITESRNTLENNVPPQQLEYRARVCTEPQQLEDQAEVQAPVNGVRANGEHSNYEDDLSQRLYVEAAKDATESFAKLEGSIAA